MYNMIIIFYTFIGVASTALWSFAPDYFGVFEGCLKALESGRRFDKDQITSLVAETRNAIDQILTEGSSETG
jgi:hypothetical protein